VLVDMIFMRMVEVTIMQVVDMAAVPHGGVAATRTMLVSVARMVGCRAISHGGLPFLVQDPRTSRCGPRPRGR
jgi:hypothetical protein